MKKAVFLDRDGTIVREANLLTHVRQLRLLPHAGAALRLLKKRGFLLILVTNQPVVARGLITEEELQRIHRELSGRLKRCGVSLDALYYCPHHPEATLPKYRRRCLCRKPGTAFFRKAMKKFEIDRKKSFMIGDSTRDVLAGRRAGLKTILVKTGYGGLDKKFNVTSDFVAKNLFQAAKIIQKC